MKTRIITLVALVAAWLPARAIDNLDTLLPEDVTVYLGMKDSSLFEKLDEHPMAKAVGGSELKKIFGPWMAKQKEAQEKAEKIYKEEVGMTFAEVKKSFAGASAIGVKVDFAQMFMKGFAAGPGGGAPELPKGLFDLTAAMSFTGDEAMAEKLGRAYGRIFKEMTASALADMPFPLAKFPEEYDSSTEDYAGVKIHTWKLKKGAKSLIESPSYAIHDGALILGLTEQGLRASIDRVKKGGKSLADSPRHSALAKSVKDSDVIAYYDLSSIIKSGMNMAAQQGGAAAGQTLSMLRALGVNKLDLLYLTLSLSHNRSDVEMGLTFHDNPGIMKLMTAASAGTPPNFIPPDAASLSYGGMDLGKMLTIVEGLVKDAMPAMGDVIDAQLAEIKKETGVDIRKDILANLGTDIVSAGAGSDETAAKDDKEAMDPAIFAIKLKDRKALELAVTTLINKAGADEALFEKREYQGHKINNLKDMPIGYVFTDDWLVISMGPQTLLEKTLTRMVKGGDGHLFALPSVKSALEGLPAVGDVGTGYFDVEQTLDSLMEMASGLGEVPGFDELIDMKNLPKKMNLPLVLGFRQYGDDTSSRVRFHFAEKKK